MKEREIKARKDFGICAVCEEVYSDLEYDISEINKDFACKCGVEGMIVIFRSAEEPVKE